MSKVVIISGYFNPIHVGHIDLINDSKSLGDTLVVIVNNDKQVGLKGSNPFMAEDERVKLVQAIKGVDTAILSVDGGRSVIETLELIKDMYCPSSIVSKQPELIFANGGDRFADDIPENKFCKVNGIKTVFNVGGKKTQSSSELISNSFHN